MDTGPGKHNTLAPLLGGVIGTLTILTAMMIFLCYRYRHSIGLTFSFAKTGNAPPGQPGANPSDSGDDKSEQQLRQHDGIHQDMNHVLGNDSDSDSGRQVNTLTTEVGEGKVQQ
jgi:hypothetical protein